MAGKNKKSRAAVTRAVTKLYQSISFRAGHEPDLDSFERLLYTDARLVHVSADGAETSSVAEFTKRFRNQVRTGELKSFHEEQLSGSLELFGGIAHVLSTYAAQIELHTATAILRGINSIQLLRDGSRWRVASIAWYDETADEQIPPEYLPESKRSIR